MLTQCFHSLYRSAALMLKAVGAGNDGSITRGISASSGWSGFSAQLSSVFARMN